MPGASVLYFMQHRWELDYDEGIDIILFILTTYEEYGHW